MKIRKILLVVLVFAAAADADVTLPRVFSDYMVLQRDAKIAVWGKADPGEQVTVSFADQAASTTADESGKWRVDLPPLPASTQGRELVVRGANNRVAFEDVLVGEVWVCSGQSNMEWGLRLARDAEAETAAANVPLVRFFNVSPKKKPAREEQFDVDPEISWQVCTSESSASFSSVGYFFGRDLHEKLGVPVGLINVSYSAMPAEAFTPVAAIKSVASLQPILDRFAAAVENYPQASAAYQKKLAEWEQAKADAEAKGEKPPPRPWPPMGPDSPSAPGALWNGMIAPIAPFSMRGVIWYQGESNAPRWQEYPDLLSTMIAAWRERWNAGDFPFLIVQLANFQEPTTRPVEEEATWPLLREAQAIVVSRVPNTALAVSIDIGEPDIHPKDKKNVGLRLARAAEKLAYGRDVVYSGPVFKSMRIEGDSAVLSFDHAGRGLVAGGGKLLGFAARGGSGDWQPAEAKVSDDGKEVIVRVAGVEKIAAVRYAWATNPRATLYNRDGLPAVPFRTDR